MPRYPGLSFEINSPLFRRSAGEAMRDHLSEAEAEAYDRALPADARDDYIQEGIFAKQLAAWMEAGLKAADLPVAENLVEDFGRLLVVRDAAGSTVHIVCCNDDDEDRAEDGNGHLIAVHPKPGLKARLLRHRALEDFTARIAEAIARMIEKTPEIQLVRKD